MAYQKKQTELFCNLTKHKSKAGLSYAKGLAKRPDGTFREVLMFPNKFKGETDKYGKISKHDFVIRLGEVVTLEQLQGGGKNQSEALRPMEVPITPPKPEPLDFTDSDIPF